MRHPDEAPLLRSIAEDYADHSRRLVLADWLEERGDDARSAFLRVQCELAAPGLAEDRRRALRLRERALLEAHRHEWLQAFDLPLEDVCFERGLIAGARLSQWDGGQLLDAERASRLVTLQELDLSELRIGDAGLTAFAKTAQFPALRKLVLSDNGISNAGVIALAAAAGLPKLDTVYLFRNSIKDIPGARAALERAAHYCLANLDLGEPAEGYCLSPGETEVARRQFIRAHLLPMTRQHFQAHERLQSAMLCVAQYWNDEANDAVHGTLVVSELFEPTLKVSGWYDEESPSDLNLPNTRITGKYGESGSAIDFLGTHWDDNSGAIPLWAAFSPEGGSQQYEQLDEAYAPAVMFYRHGGYEFLPMQRPHLDGIRPEWGAE